MTDFWITTHWPPRKGHNYPNDNSSGVWLPDGREAAGRDLKKGDKVFIYQSRSGRPELHKKVDGSQEIIRCKRGKEGIIAVCEAQDSIYAEPDSEPTIYTDGTTIWWRWYAPLKILSKSGFVHREKVNPILGYSPNYPLRGFGDDRSGLKKISEQQFNDLLKMFTEGVNIPSPKTIILPKGKAKSGPEGVESQEHFLLKVYAAVNPSQILSGRGFQSIQLEYSFPTGDRADILMADAYGRVLGIEIEVAVDDDQFEGLLQAIKYRYMGELQARMQPGDSRAILIAYRISKKMKFLCEDYNIECYEVDKATIERWSQTDQGKSEIAKHQHQRFIKNIP